MSVIEITNRDDLRVGDTATFTYDGHEFTGVVWEREEGTLFIGAEAVRYEHRATGELRWSEFLDFVRAVREVPDLPTEPGSVIYVARLIDAEPYTDPSPMLLMANGQWVTTNPGARGEHMWLIAEQIAEWTPAKVVPA